MNFKVSSFRRISGIISMSVNFGSICWFVRRLSYMKNVGLSTVRVIVPDRFAITNKCVIIDSFHTLPLDKIAAPSCETSCESVPATPENIVIVGYGQIGRSFEQILNAANAKVKICEIGKHDDDEKFFDDWGSLGISFDDVDFVIVAVKAYHLKSAVESVPPALRDKLVFVQNGLGIEEVVDGVDGVRNAIYGVLFLSAKDMESGGTMVVAKPSHFYGGKAGEFVALLNRGREGFAAEPESNDVFLKVKLMKGVVNVVYNAICTIWQMPVKSTYNRFGREKIEAMVREVVTVLNSHYGREVLGFEEALATINTIRETWANEVPTTYKEFWGEIKPGESFSGLDIRDKIPEGPMLTEMDHLLGFIVKEGEKRGISIPVCVDVHEMLKQLEGWISEIKGKVGGIVS